MYFDKFAVIRWEEQGLSAQTRLKGNKELTSFSLLCLLETPTTKTANSESSSETTTKRRPGVPGPTSPNGSWPDTRKCTNSAWRCELVQHRPLRHLRQRKKIDHFPFNLSRPASISVKMRSEDLHMVSTRLITSAFSVFLWVFPGFCFRPARFKVRLVRSFRFMCMLSCCFMFMYILYHHHRWAYSVTVMHFRSFIAPSFRLSSPCMSRRALC
jgi:hypothetical protein